MEAQLKEVELEQKALTWPQKAKAIAIRDQESYDQAAGLLVNIADLEHEIIAHHKPIKDTAYAAHKAAVAAEKRLLDPLTEAKSIITRSIGAWEVEQEAIRREAKRKAQEEARRLEEEARLALAADAEVNGASEETVQEILATAVPVPAPVIRPTFERAAGVSTRQNWKAEIYDMRLLVKAIAEGKASLEFIQANTTALNAMARAMKGTMNIPGVRAVPETSVAVRR